MFTTRLMGGLLALAVATTTVTPGTALAASAAEIDRNVDAVLIKLYAAVPKARELEARAKGILVFPKIYKAGFMFGAQYGEGALRIRHAVERALADPANRTPDLGGKLTTTQMAERIIAAL